MLSLYYKTVRNNRLKGNIMKAIKYQKFDINGVFVGEAVTARKFTVRGAMEHLEKQGFEPIFPNGKKLQRLYTNDHFNAHII